MARNVTQVGLGTARNFSSARPLFQNIAENVPIAGRAFYEADWDMKLREEREKFRPKKYNPGKENQSVRQVFEPIRTRASVAAPAPTAVSDSVAHVSQAELDHYFPAPAVPAVTTYLLIPLAPTPTARFPLADSPSVHNSHHPLIPLSYLLAIHSDHGTHTLRVSSLFARLDTARVFEEPGVTRSAHGHPSGLCTVLVVKFAGWTEARVRGILGEAGTGWCVLEEVHENESEAAAMDDAMSEMSFDTGTPAEQEHPSPAMDPSASFILPTLDFSASFTAERGSWARATSHARAPSPIASTSAFDLGFHDAWSSSRSSSRFGSDAGSDLDALSDIAEAFSSGSASPFGSSGSRSPPTSDEWFLTFSSSFSDRMSDVREETGPREVMF